MTVGLYVKERLLQTCPLVDVSVQAVMDGALVKVALTHVFENQGPRAIEAIYTFPLPVDAHVSRFVARVNGVTIEGAFEEKDVAYAQYERAKGRGDSAYLLESHREDVFQLSLGNIGVGEQVQVTTEFVQPLEQVDEEIRWSLPTVLAPRYTPGRVTGPQVGPGLQVPTDRVTDADFVSPPIGDARYGLSLLVDVLGVPGLRKVASPSHQIGMELVDGGYRVRLAREVQYLDSDFVLVLTCAEEPESAIVWGGTEQTPSGQWTYGVLDLCLREDEVEDDPNAVRVFEDFRLLPKKKEYIFMIDVSGSMGGVKLEQAKRALKLCLRNLAEGDVFNLVAFESRFDKFSSKAVPFTQGNLNLADKWVDGLRPLGGTEIYLPLKWILNNPYEGIPYMRRMLFLFTDGEVTNEKEIINLIQEDGGCEVFPFGIDTAVNEAFIRGVAKAGNGLPEFVYPGERIDSKVMRQFDRISRVTFSEMKLDFGDGFEVEYAAGVLDEVFANELVRIPFRVRHLGEPPVSGVVRATVSSFYGPNSPSFVAVREVRRGDAGLVRLAYGKALIRGLEAELDEAEGRMRAGVEKEIVRASIAYGVLTTRTSLIAVYNRRDKLTGVSETITVPVALPRMWAESKVSILESLEVSPIFEDRVMPTYSKGINNLELFRKNEVRTDPIEILIQNVIQLQQADGLIAGEIIKTVHFIAAMRLVAKKYKSAYRIPIEKAEKAVPVELVAFFTQNNKKTAKQILQELLG
jgi:Ca-activated chloride channel family protein